ncbi:MAG: substrate-binding domain-containing protein, partial [Planctomycetota bacterium]|nr:substrate-binding domain-containing protein [Planctomycetota bacterium]
YNHMYWSKERLEGFRLKLKKAGFKVHLYSPLGSAEPLSGSMEQTVLAQWLKSLPKPIGLMVCNDDCGRGVMDACRLAELKVPDEVAVLGVDDDQMICTLTTPPMSSIKLDFERAGYEAAQALDRLMSKKSSCEKDIIVHPMHVVTRQSTDVLAIEDREVSAAIRFIRSHAGEMITVEDVVGSTAMSRRQLERHFRQILARTILSEIHRVHIQRACELLIETNWPLRRIADHCGFSNATHIGIIFRQQMNMTCAEYRTGHRH